MENMEAIINQLGLENQIFLQDIPNIDLYMDQVIQLFENKFQYSKRNDDEKILTKTMINNYAKGKLLFPIENKKYSKEHLMLISLIYQLKGALSINDIKKTLHGVNQKVMEEDGSFDLSLFYECCLRLADKNVKQFTESIRELVAEAEEEIKPLDDQEKNYLENVLLIASLVNMSNYYRRAAEKLVDNISETNDSQ
ncbi:protein of unknown function [Evansella caseinilytica]|uniref:DUF1836 domain-containing protein n=1 Tax=Evansella caseinilytica TaxID=1503961 RepID=A0A1H3UPN6_9BACI|nr:DUF1836 domain-containing protein [Evansella caseinilytica]SDZ64410.1 protein of unknown function [Evansella caseinilytica]